MIHGRVRVSVVISLALFKSQHFVETVTDRQTVTECIHIHMWQWLHQHSQLNMLGQNKCTSAYDPYSNFVDLNKSENSVDYWFTNWALVFMASVILCYLVEGLHNQLPVNENLEFMNIDLMPGFVFQIFWLFFLVNMFIFRQIKNQSFMIITVCYFSRKWILVALLITKKIRQYLFYTRGICGCSNHVDFPTIVVVNGGVMTWLCVSYNETPVRVIHRPPVDSPVRCHVMHTFNAFLDVNLKKKYWANNNR